MKPFFDGEQVVIDFSGDHSPTVDLTLYSVNGQSVCSFKDAQLNPGRNRFHLTKKAKSGVYFLTIRSDHFANSYKLLKP